MRRLMMWALTVAVLCLLPVTALARDDGSPAVSVALPGGRALRFGNRGQTVADLQRLLRSAGFNPGPIDGIFGPLTEGAVKTAQRSLGLEVDGLAGRLTVSAVQARVAHPAPEPVATAATPVAAASTSAPAQTSAPSSSLVVHRAGARTGGLTPAVANAAHQRFALTFNGAPDPQLLPILLETLQRHGMQATFFIYGETAERSPDLVGRIAAAGHEVASNGLTAADMTRLAPDAMAAQLSQAQRAIAAAAGAAPVHFRPPLGIADSKLQQTAEQSGLKLVLWTNVAVHDTPDSAPADLAERLKGTVYPGAVVMLHQDRKTSVEALEILLSKLQAEGYQSAALSELDRP